MRINRFVAQALGIARREADDLITTGRIAINGTPAELGQQVNAESQVTLDGEPINKQPYQYLMLNKPTGYVCSKNRQADDPTVYELLPKELQHLKTVGRLDKDSSGLIIFSNDGEFTQLMTHPSNKKEKVYEVRLDRALDEDTLAKLAIGIELEDGVSKLEVSNLGVSKYLVHMAEGRNRQIRRTFGSLNYTLKSLHRVKFGDYSLDDLAEGEYREFEFGVEQA